MKNSTVYSATLGVREKRGNPQIWIESRRIDAAGFCIGASYSVHFDSDRRVITLQQSATGDRQVSRKKAAASYVPLIELNNKALAELLPEGVDRVNVSARRGEIEITVPERDVQIAQRVERLQKRLAEGKPLRVGECFAGGGVMADAIHQGFKESGIATSTEFLVEFDKGYLNQLLLNERLIDDHTKVLNQDIRDVDLNAVPPVDLLVQGIPCAGASRAGRTRKGLPFAEADPLVGSLFMDALNLVKASGFPCLLMFENVPDYAKTIGCEVIRNVLGYWGYELHERVLDQSVGALEARRRWVLVAVAEGLDFDFDRLIPEPYAPQCMGDILEEVPEDSPLWRPMTYLFEKQKRDIAMGKGHRVKVIDPIDTSVMTIRANYHKSQSDSPLVAHPSQPGLFRLLTVSEHAKIKDVPERIVEGAGSVLGHTILGQGVLYNLPRSVAKVIAGVLFALSGGARQADKSIKGEIPAASDPSPPVGGAQLDMFEVAA